MSDLPILPGYKKNSSGKVVPDGYPKWAKDNTSTKANDPANQINRAKGEPQKEAPGVTFNHDNTSTINDGRTDVVVSHLNKPKVPGELKLGQPKQHYPPCINPTCKSFGKSHPNCLCYAGPGGTSLEDKTGWEPGYGPGFAHGGCVGTHKEQCEYFASGGDVEVNHKLLHNPQVALDHVGAQHGLLHLLTETGQNGRAESPHKHLENYVDSSKKGHKSLNNHISSLIGSEKMDTHHDKESVSALKAHLDDLQANPEKALDIGGSLGSVLPMHGAALGAKTANALNYFQSLKPTASQGSPLDPVMPPSKSSQNSYDRQLGIAQNPMLILKHSKEGTLQPEDLKTLHTIYPFLAQSMTQKAGEALIDAKDRSKMPYRQKQGLSALLGQPLDSIQTVSSMQAIMQANSPTQAPAGQKSPKNVTNKAIDQINKTTEDLATPDQKRLMGKS